MGDLVSERSFVWGVFNKPNDLWVQVLKSKYQKRVNLPMGEVGSKMSDSYLWKSLQPFWPILLQNMVISLGDGSNTLFWQDRWLGDETSLSDWCPANGPTNEHFALVNSFVLPNGEWDLPKFHLILPSNVVEKIRALPAPLPTDGSDRNVWSRTKEGDFLSKRLNGVDLICLWVRDDNFILAAGTRR